MQLWARGRMEGRKEGKARGEARLGRAVSRARQRAKRGPKGAIRVERSDGMSRFYTQEVGQNIPRRARRNREGGMHLSFIPRKRTFLSILLLLLLCRALSLSLRPTKTRFPFVLTARLLFQRNCPFPYIPFPPPPHRLVFLLVLAITLLFPSDHGENVVSHLMLAGHRAPHIKGVRF